MNKTLGYILFLLILIIILFIGNLFFGSVSIPPSEVVNILLGKSVDKQAWSIIVLDSRLPQAITTLFTGAALAISGLLLQTAFRNPLADPGILGISSGANLGVALVVFLLGNNAGMIAGTGISYSISVVFGAFVGASVVLAIIMGFASIIRNNIILLIIGIMIGYLASSIITILKFWSSSENVYSFMLWGMGDFSGVTKDQLLFYCVLITVGLITSLFLIKPLNALLLGDKYASNLGVNIKSTRFLLLLCAGLLTATTSAFCGPIAFIGLTVPHIARLFFKTSNHKILLPTTILIGVAISLICNIISVMPQSSEILPLNAITPIFGVPVILYVILNQRKIQYFN